MALRILGGLYRGHMINYPKKSKNTRPSQSILREALFNIIFSTRDLAGVLDMCAGSGALGIEAISRGATSAVFVDIDPSAARTIKENLEKLKISDKTSVVCGDIRKKREQILLKAPFSHIFFDPPYARDLQPQGWVLETFEFFDHSHGAPDLFLEEGIDTYPERVGSFSLISKRSFGTSYLYHYRCD